MAVVFRDELNKVSICYLKMHRNYTFLCQAHPVLCLCIPGLKYYIFHIVSVIMYCMYVCMLVSLHPGIHMKYVAFMLH